MPRSLGEKEVVLCSQLVTRFKPSRIDHISAGRNSGITMMYSMWYNEMHVGVDEVYVCV